MSSLGNIEEFDISKPSLWDNYSERLGFYLEANNIKGADRKRAVLLSVCGSSTYDILRSLLSPTPPASVPFEQLLQVLKNHFAPQPSEIVRRFQFHKRDQRQGETVVSYITDLRRLAEYCNFGNNLEVMLRDRLVCGVRDETLQRRLLAETQLTFVKAQEYAVASEVAQEHIREIRNHTTENICKVSQDKHKRFNKLVKNWEKPCYRCNGRHAAQACHFKDAICRACGRKGHIERACRNKKSQYQKKTVPTNNITQEDSVDPDEYIIQQLSHPENSSTAYRTAIKLNNKNFNMEIDSGAAFTIISRNTFEQLHSNGDICLKPTTVVLKDYQGKSVSVLGMCSLNVQRGKYSKILNALVCEGNGVSLLGRNWFRPLGICLNEVNQVNTDVIKEVLDEYSGIFKSELGAYNGPLISLKLDNDIQPIRMKARSVPFVMKTKIDDWLNKQLDAGVLEAIDFPKWATPIVPVLKPDGSIRVCGDYKCTVNKALQKCFYPVPAVKDLLATLVRGKVFAKLDLAQAYLQLGVDDATAEIQTIVTHRGAFKVKRLQFGISTAPGIFQQLMDTLLAGLPGVLPYFDDILIVAMNREELAVKLREVFHRLMNAGLRLEKKKCSFNQTEVEYLGYRISAQGIHPTSEKVRAILEAPSPKNRKELQAFLGLLNFYHSFLNNKATIAEPLHRLLDVKSRWKWSKIHEEAFTKVKELISSDAVLASPYGVGAVLSQRTEDGNELPIAYHSRTLTKAERNYAQLDKEALAIVAGIKKFHDYVYGRKIEIRTDHKPLLGLLSSDRPTPQTLSPRMIRWNILLSGYIYTLKYVPGSSLANADALSRVPLPGPHKEIPDVGEVFMLNSNDDIPLSSEKIRQMTLKDKSIQKIINSVKKGWPNYIEDDLKLFFVRRSELSVYKDCLLWGNRVVIPREGRSQVLSYLHAYHPGIVRMKGLARSYVWWPRIDHEIEQVVRNCSSCQLSRHSPPKASPLQWERTTNPWSRLHVDFAGPFQGKIFFLTTDSYSKWLDVQLVRSTSTNDAIKCLRNLFATHGIPDTITSDNGKAFTSYDFRQFCFKNGIRHIRIAPFHPASNGQAERMVQTTKDNLKRIVSGDWSCRLARFLLAQHTTPCTATGKSPAELLMGRCLKTCLDNLHPKTIKEKELENKPVSGRNFKEGDTIFCRDYRRGGSWTPAIVVDVTGPRSYKIKTNDDQIWKRHVDQMISREESCLQSDENKKDSTKATYSEEDV